MPSKQGTNATKKYEDEICASVYSYLLSIAGVCHCAVSGYKPRRYLSKCPGTQDSICDRASPCKGSNRCKQPEQVLPYQITAQTFCRFSLSSTSHLLMQVAWVTFSIGGFDDEVLAFHVLQRLSGSYAVCGQTDPTVRIGLLHLVPLWCLHFLVQDEYQVSPLPSVSLSFRGFPGYCL